MHAYIGLFHFAGVAVRCIFIVTFASDVSSRFDAILSYANGLSSFQPFLGCMCFTLFCFCCCCFSYLSFECHMHITCKNRTRTTTTTNHWKKERRKKKYFWNLQIRAILLCYFICFRLIPNSVRRTKVVEWTQSKHTEKIRAKLL